MTIGYHGAMDALAASRRRFVTRLAARFLVRFHMSVMFAGTLAAALLTSRLLRPVSAARRSGSCRRRP